MNFFESETFSILNSTKRKTNKIKKNSKKFPKINEDLKN